MSNLLPLLLKGIKTRKVVPHSYQALNVLQSTTSNTVRGLIPGMSLIVCATE